MLNGMTTLVLGIRETRRMLKVFHVEKVPQISKYRQVDSIFVKGPAQFL